MPVGLSPNGTASCVRCHNPYDVDRAARDPDRCPRCQGPDSLTSRGAADQAAFIDTLLNDPRFRAFIDALKK